MGGTTVGDTCGGGGSVGTVLFTTPISSFGPTSSLANGGITVLLEVEVATTDAVSCFAAGGAFETGVLLALTGGLDSGKAFVSDTDTGGGILVWDNTGDMLFATGAGAALEAADLAFGPLFPGGRVSFSCGSMESLYYVFI